MIPILYSTITEGTVPTNYGVGALTDCLATKTQEELNGKNELTLTYPANGIHAEEIQVNRFIKAKPNYTDNPQLFRIYKVGKAMNGKFEVKAQHISYDLSGKIITTGTANNCAAACALLQAKAGSFTINTDKTTSAAFAITTPSSVRSWFGGKEGSLLDVYGGEWKYDNYTASLKASRGTDRGVTIRYGKNLTQLSQELDMSNLVTGIIPYYIDPDGNKTVGNKVNTGLTLDVTRDVAIDFTQDVDPESGTAITTQLANLANAYKNTHNLTAVVNSITLDFVQSGELTERVDLGDTVHIYFEALGITAALKCVATTWDVLAERYTSTTFGVRKTNIADTISQASRELAQVPSSSFMAEAIAHATDLITGNLGGYVILHDSNGDGEPDEILIMNTADISTATQVWRWNKNGLGYATSYAGTYGTAITQDGKIVANYITTGTLDASKITVTHLSATSIDTGTLDGTKATITNINASNINTGTLNADLIKAGTLNCSLITVSNLSASSINTGTLNADLIKAGTISDAGGNSSINMTNGVASMKNFDAKNRFRLLSTAGVEKVKLVHNSGSGSNLTFYTEGGTDCGGVASSSNGLQFVAKNGSGVSVGQLQWSSSGGGGLYIANNVGTTVGYIVSNSAQGGTLALYDSVGTNTILGSGDSGNVRCVSLTQTSSRKVKKNIEELTSEEARKLLELEPVSFDYKNEAQGTDRRGFIAEDVAKVLPNIVTPESEEAPASLDYVQLIPYLVKMVQDQAKDIEELKKKIEQLGG